MIPITCPRCQTRILVPPTVQGRAGLCFGCGAPLQVPHTSAALDEQMVLFAPGTQVAERYLIEECIGKGGMGVVYRAQDTLIRELVALKFLNPTKLRNPRAQRLFIQEAQIARRLRHENIAAVHDVSTTGEGVPYLSMEFLRGETLRAYLRVQRQRRKLLPVRLAVHLTKQILAALEYAHRTVVHRDVKPENVMLLPGEHVKVLDFGLALALDDEAPERASEAEKGQGRLLGTAAYAAPEQRLHHEIDNRADLYAVGLMLRELLTLRVPTEAPYTVEEVREDVAPGVLSALNKALAPEKTDRWQSAAAFRESLTEAYEKAYRQSAPTLIVSGAHRIASIEGMIHLEGGSFLMGSNDTPDEAPEFETEVGAYYMDPYPVTVAAYRTYLKATGQATPKYWGLPNFSGADQPVVGVSWEEAMAYAAWAGKELPSEAQWEFAARGKDNRRYPWGAQEPDSTRCNYGCNVNMPSIVYLHEDGGTPQGIHDLAGNVFEWTRDPFVPYALRPRGQAAHESAPRKAARGGCWNSPPHELRSSFRRGFFPNVQAPSIGFRCVVRASG